MAHSQAASVAVALGRVALVEGVAQPVDVFTAQEMAELAASGKPTLIVARVGWWR